MSSREPNQSIRTCSGAVWPPTMERSGKDEIVHIERTIGLDHVRLIPRGSPLGYDAAGGVLQAGQDVVMIRGQGSTAYRVPGQLTGAMRTGEVAGRDEFQMKMSPGDYLWADRSDLFPRVSSPSQMPPKYDQAGRQQMAATIPAMARAKAQADRAAQRLNHDPLYGAKVTYSGVYRSMLTRSGFEHRYWVTNPSGLQTERSAAQIIKEARWSASSRSRSKDTG